MKETVLPRPVPLYRQIYEKLRHSIISKEMPAGSRLPSTQELSLQFGAAPKTIQQAMICLERESLIVRKQKLGSFVCAEKPRLSRVGIYFDVDILSTGGVDFYRLLYAKLQVLLQRERIEHHLFIEQHGPSHFPKSILAAAGKGEIQALIAPLLSCIDDSAKAELGIPVICDTHADCQDLEKMFNDACMDLSQSGSRSVGFISHFGGKWATEIKSSFFNAAKKAGLKSMPQWVSHPPEWIPFPEFEEFAYNAFVSMAEKSLPDSLIVYPDTMARGTLMAVMGSGLKVPEQLKLVLHENMEIPLFAPFEFTSLHLDSEEVARSLLSTAMTMVQGEEPAQRKISYSISKHKAGKK